MSRATRNVRHADRAALRRYVGDEFGTTPRVPLLDLSDCQHGCAGGRYGCTERCNFTCHEDHDD